MKKSLLLDFSKYVTLNILGMLGLSCYILADTYLIANGIGSEGLTALNFAISVYSFIHGTGLMVGIGGATRYNIQKSSKDIDNGNQTFTTTVRFGLIIGFVYFSIGILLAKQIGKLLGADGEILAMTAIYLRTILCFSPCFILNNILIAFIRNDGSPRTAMAGMLTGSISNILLDYIFIFIFDMGMFGAAFATGLAPIISMLVMSHYFIRKENDFHLITNSNSSYSLCLNVCKLGISAFVSEIASGVVLIVFNLLFLNLSGNIGVAAYGIVANLSLIALSIFTGIGQGIQPLVSHYYSIGKSNYVKGLLRYANVLSFILAAVLYIIIMVFGDSIVKLFNRDNIELLNSIAKNGLYIYFTGFFFAGINIVLSAYFSAIEKAKTGFFIALLRGFIVVVPLSIVLSIIWGINGVWITFLITEFIVFIFGVVKSNMLERSIRK